MSTVTETRMPSSAGRRRAGRVLLYVVLVLGGLVMLYPLAWMLSSSLKPEDQIFTTISLIPRTLDLSNYPKGWSGINAPFSLYFMNSFIIAGGAVVGNLVACSLTAYAFARIRFRLRAFLFGVMLLTIMLPRHATLIPQYILFFNLGWVNTYLPLIVPKFLATDAFFIFLMVQFIRTIPRDLDDAASVDGCGHGRIFFHVVLPLLRPALITTGIFTFIWTYDDFFGQLVYLTNSSLYTVPVALRTFLDSSHNSAWGPMFAMSIVSLIPTFVIFLVMQRRLVEGISTTGLRG